ncbi:hypothetical protein I0C86_01080 [Plantactinospora sp. S1510]|uniref:Uncharacterized protein n=1 Tax=Plantactinospora alkalitolerans TaxID=2789879 RepID=A0ABS0GN33_9ACTN|nr:hypothetical protein [Plantactinospora alkalitolerans]MBF9127596.1 hypothetical protein [Plantactinospora alkalitolerans]
MTVVAVSGIFGGLDTVDRSKLPTVELGAVDRGKPWNVTVVRVRLIADLPAHKPTTAGNHWVGVVATVEVTAPESRADLWDVLRLPGAEGLRSEKPAYVVLMRDDTERVRLNPGMPEQLAFVWERAGDSRPSAVTVQILGKTLRQDSLTGTMTWLDPAPRAEVVAPVEDQRT